VCESYRRAFPQIADKFVTITNGYDAEAFEVIPRPAALDDDICIAHVGELYAGRDPKAMCAAVVRLGAERDRPIKLDFYGRTGNLANEIAARGWSHVVRVHGHLPYREAIETMQRADILLLLDSAGRELGVPAKIEYIGAGRPILALAEPGGDTAWALRESRAVHRLVHPDDNPGIEKAISELTAHVEMERQLGARRPPATCSAGPQFTRAHAASQLAMLLDRVCGETSKVAGHATSIATIIAT
jgi:glycosyltransferase involved in cell wall biosynthesis